MSSEFQTRTTLMTGHLSVSKLFKVP